MPKRALVTGVTGQDGAYLARWLIEKGYEVHGTYRRSASGSNWRLAELGVADEVRMVPIDLLEFSNVWRTLEKVAPDEVYNLAAQSFVGISYEQPIYTAEVDALGVARLLEAVRLLTPAARYYQASTSEMFGKVQEVPQRELTPFYPRSPYGIAKLYGHWLTINYRESYGLHASAGILFNHESPLRGEEFVTRKITKGFACIRHGAARPLELGNLDAKRDWGFAGDYVRGMWLMLQQETPDDYVLATGETRSVREFVERAAEAAGFKIAWDGEGEQERGVDERTGREIVRVNPDFYRPAEVDLLIGNSGKAAQRLGWKPEVSFDALVAMMVRADMDRATGGALTH